MKPFRGAVFFVFLSVLPFISCSKNSENNPVSPADQICTVTGKVIFTFSGSNAIEDVTVSLSGEDIDLDTVTDREGKYTFNDIPVGRYTLTPQKTKYIFGPPNREITIVNNRYEVEDFFGNNYLQENMYIVVGKVVDRNNKPVPVVKVFAGNSLLNCYTNELGYFSSGFFGKDKTYTVRCSKEGYEFEFIPESITVTISDTITVCFFTAFYSGPPLHSISGKVTDFDGVSIQASITLKDDLSRERTIETDATGKYEITGLINGEYTLKYIVSYLYRFEDNIRNIQINGEDVTVPDVRAVNNHTLYSVYGRVIDSKGAGIPALTVGIYSFTVLNYELITESQTDSDGSYTDKIKVPRDKEKTYVIIPHKENFSFEPDSTKVTLAWIKNEKNGGDIIIPDILGIDHGVISAGYFPLAVSSLWIYRRTEGDGDPHEATIEVTGTVEINGKTYFRLSERGPWGFTDYRVDSRFVFALSGAEEVIFLRLGVKPRTEWFSGLEGNVYPRTGTYLGVETVVTPAGTFENCARFRSSVTYSADSYDSYDLWYAHDVGLVKSVKVIMSYGKLLEQVTDELKANTFPF